MLVVGMRHHPPVVVERQLCRSSSRLHTNTIQAGDQTVTAADPAADDALHALTRLRADGAQQLTQVRSALHVPHAGRRPKIKEGCLPRSVAAPESASQAGRPTEHLGSTVEPWRCGRAGTVTDRGSTLG